MADVEPSEPAVKAAYDLAAPCRICPRNCGVNRLRNERGHCGIGAVPLVSSAAPHFGEEPPLVGRGGSGTIFLAGCSLLCAFCQNYEISHGRAGRPAEPARIADMMLALERNGCENVNLVTPTHVAPWLMDAVRTARLGGLSVPVVYNCGGYETVETLRLLEGTVDIYMPDAKFWLPESAQRYARAPDYPEQVRDALKEMQRQVGDLRIEDGVALGGLLIRHLVMPGGTAESTQILDFIAREVSPSASVNVMAQYRPLYKARDYPEISRPVARDEYHRVRDHAREMGLRLV